MRECAGAAAALILVFGFNSQPAPWRGVMRERWIRRSWAFSWRPEQVMSVIWVSATSSC